MISNRLVGGSDSAPVYRHPMLEQISLYVHPLSGAPDELARRRVRWTPLAASMAAIRMALDARGTLGERCRDGLACLSADFTGKRGVGRTYNDLQKALERQSKSVPPLLRRELRSHAREALGILRRTEGWIVLAVDGSKAELPRTVSNEGEFGLSDNGVVPQAFETVIVDVYTGLPWDWRVGQGKDCEKKHLEEMIPELPADTLLLADCNFGGHPIWSALDAKGLRFLIRVGGNASFVTGLFPDAKLDRRGDIIYAWPKKRQETEAPLRLRLIRVGTNSNPVYLVTNELDQKKLSKRQAGTLYRARRGRSCSTARSNGRWATPSSRVGRAAGRSWSWNGV